MRHKWYNRGMEVLMKTLGRITGLTIREITQHKLRFIIMVFAVWLGIVSNVNIPDSMAQDFLMTTFLIGVIALIFGVISFRAILITRGALRISKL